MSSSKKISVVIVTWNSSNYLDKCLSSLQKQRNYIFDMVVVDNGSSDDSLLKVRKYFPSAKIIKNSENMGFAAANNQGIQNCSEDYVLLLNTDCFLEEEYVQNLIEFLDRNQDVAGVQGKLLNYSTPVLIDSLGIDINFAGVAKDILQGKNDCSKKLNREFEVTALCAAAAIYKRSSLVKLGEISGEIFDTDFFSYYEDVDLGIRLRKLGHKLYCIPTATAYHVRGGTQKDLVKMYKLSLRNKYFVIIKNWPLIKILVHLPIILGWELIKVIKFLFTNPFILVGYLDVVRDFRLFLSKRHV